MKTSAEGNLKKLKNWGVCSLIAYHYSKLLRCFWSSSILTYNILFSTKFLTEDGLFDMIRSSKPIKKSLPERTNKGTEKICAPPKTSPQKEETRGMNCTLVYHALWIFVSSIY